MSGSAPPVAAGRTPWVRLRRRLAGTITRKLLAAFLLVFFTTYLATATVVLTAVRSALTRAELATLDQLAHRRLNELNARIGQLAVNLQAWSRLDVMNDLASEDVDKRIERALENLKNDYALAGDLYAFDAHGHLVASSAHRQGSPTLPEAWRADGPLRVVDKHRDPFGDGYLLALTSAITASFAPGYRMGTLVLTYPWSEVRRTLDGEALLVRTGDRAAILDATLPASADTLAALAEYRGEEGWIPVGDRYLLVNRADNRDGPLARWSVIVLGDSAPLQKTLAQVAMQLAVLCAVLALPLTFGIRWLAHRLTASLRELTRFVAGITATGDLSARVAVAADDEIGTLATAFNHMAAKLEGAAAEREQLVRRLKRFNEALEEQVEHRTGELMAANGELTSALKELQSAQSQLIHQEKMASLGQLVAGVAHEINNPIGFIYANFPHMEEYARTLLGLVDEVRSLPMPDDSRARFERAVEEADLDFLRSDLLKIIRSGQSGATRVKEIISSLRSFSRLDEAVEKSVRLEEGLDDTLALLRPHLKQRIEVVLDYRLDIPVLCHPGQLNQVFMNLIYNAVQAIEGPGTLTLSTWREGDFAAVAVADTGKGIPEALLGRIFDPFFTTKKVGEGTGLGLSISYGIVKKHGGRIDVRSESGKGTTFTLYIPIKAQPAAAGEESARAT